ncbi:MAG: DUF58 domain-containing protein, partial [Planctomycetes bacterium]|nr:DUF58 domain-containing protein [Planctomycetota bacterium]
MKIRPTELGWKGLLLFAALEVAFYATSYSNLFFLVIVFSCVLGALGLTGGVRTLRQLRVTLGAVPLAAAGAARRVPVRLAASRRLFDLEVALELDDRCVELGYVPMLRGEQVFDGELPAMPRGVVAVRGLVVTTTFPFGLLRLRRRVAAETTLVTHPAPSAGGEYALAGGDDERSSGTGRSSTTAGLRAHRRGDEVRDVHWKATARRGEPVVREWEPEGGDEIELVLDRRCRDEVFERSLADAAAVVLAAIAAERPLTLHSQGVTLRATRAAGERDQVLRW